MHHPARYRSRINIGLHEIDVDPDVEIDELTAIRAARATLESVFEDTIDVEP